MQSQGTHIIAVHEQKQQTMHQGQAVMWHQVVIRVTLAPKWCAFVCNGGKTTSRKDSLVPPGGSSRPSADGQCPIHLLLHLAGQPGAPGYSP